MNTLRTANPGFGLGLRTQHYPDFLAAKQPLDWLEIVTDNFLVDGGRPLKMLDAIRQDYPVVMHGVAMSIGSAQGIDLAYLAKVKQLADRIQPLWVSDHLCWIGVAPAPSEQLHDLYPLPYTDEAAQRVVSQIRQAQDMLGRRLVIENVSSYVSYAQSACAEWQFLSHIAQAADCLLLADVNNIYVSSVNHGFNAMDYVCGLPAERIQQVHLAGHSFQDDFIIDTHDHPVSQPVWDLYAQACGVWGAVATMIERDDHIPALPVLIAELDQARLMAAIHCGAAAEQAQEKPLTALPTHNGAPLEQLQTQFADYVLDRYDTSDMLRHIAPLAADRLDPSGSLPKTQQRLKVYHHAYRARLTEVLADSFAKTTLYMGSDLFDTHAAAFSVAQPPLGKSLNDYGGDFPAYLKTLYPNNLELYELAQLDWVLRHCFAGADVQALDLASAQADTAQSWLLRSPALVPSLVLIPVHHNVVSIWKAIDADEPVPALETLDAPSLLMVWRKGDQPHFQTVAAEQRDFLRALFAGASIADAAHAHAEVHPNDDPAKLGAWLLEWWHDGILRAQ